MLISIIAAMSNNRAIGLDNKLPWHMPADLQHFKAITMGKPILMGRKTHAALGKALPGRQNIVLSSNPNYNAPGCVVVTSLAKALAIASQTNTADEIMIIGGAKLFCQTLSLANRLYITIIAADLAGDTFFLPWNADDWIETSSDAHQPDEKNIYPYRFLQLDRRHLTIHT